MPRTYTVEHEIAALAPTAGDGLLVVEAPADLVLRVDNVKVKNVDNDIHEQLWIGTFPITTKGSLAGGGAPPTPRKHDNGDVASSVTMYEAGNAGLATEPDAWGDPFDESGDSNTIGYEYAPANPPYISPSGLFGVRMMAVPTVGRFKILITFTEIGG